MAARLIVTETRYSLLRQQEGVWLSLATLNGGFAALIPNPAVVTEAALERAIDVAEEWIMPYAKALRGDTLYVQDSTGRLTTGLLNVLSTGNRPLSVADVENYFLYAAEQVTKGFKAPVLQYGHGFLADLILLRELAHHGALASIRLCQSAEPWRPRGAEHCERLKEGP